MTVENTNNTISYTGNGSVDTFAYNFLTYSADHLKIYLNESLQTSGYTITGIGSEDGGNVVFDVAPLDNVVVFIERVLPLSQLIEYQEYGPFPAKTNERGLDYGIMIDQQLSTRINVLTESALLKNVLTEQTVIGPVEFQGKTEVVSPPTSPNDVLRLQDVDISSDTVKASFIKYNIPITAGQTVLTTPIDFQSAIVLIDGVTQFETSGAYIQDGVNSTITLAEPLEGNEIVEVWINNLFILPTSLNNTFTGLLDTPTNYDGEANKLVSVKSDSTGLEFIDQPINTNMKAYLTISEALNDLELSNYSIVDIAETVTHDDSLTFWSVVDASTITPNAWDKRIVIGDTSKAIVLQGANQYMLERRYRKTEFFGHRGALKAAPQSTLAAFSQSIAAGMDGLEFDIQTDSEGQVWVFHDPDLSPDTNLTGSINSNTTAYIEAAVRQEANGTRLDGIGIMKLEEVLQYSSALKLSIAPEMKFYGWTDNNVDALVQTLKDYDYDNDKCILSAVDVSLLERARVTSKSVTVAYGLNIDFDDAKPDIDRVIALGKGAISWDYRKLLSDSRFIDYSFENGLDVIAFVVDDVLAIKELGAKGVRAMISDQYHGGLLSAKPNNNSLGLSCGRQWENAKLYVLNPSGSVTGTVSVTGETLTCYAPVGESSKASRHINVTAGEVVTVSVLARLTSGTVAGLGIDYPTAGDLQTVTPITSDKWEWYECSFIVPLTAFEDTNCVLQFGVFGYMDGTAEFKLPRVAKGNVLRGAAQNLAMGSIYFDSLDNTPKINQGFCNNGIYGLSYSSLTKELSITIDKLQRDDPEGSSSTTGNPRLPTRPLFYGNVSFDNGGAGLTVQFSGYTYNTGVLKARFYDSTGVLVDIIPLLSGGNIFFNFKAEVN